MILPASKLKKVYEVKRLITESSISISYQRVIFHLWTNRSILILNQFIN